MNQTQVIKYQIELMQKLAGIVQTMDRHYNNFPYLNDLQPRSTALWLPASLDEWAMEISGCIEEWTDLLAKVNPPPEYPDQTHARIQQSQAADLSRDDLAALVNWSNCQEPGLINDLTTQELLNVYRMSAEYDTVVDWLAEKGNFAVRAFNHVVRPAAHINLMNERWENEFPDFHHKDMPTIPSNWVDQSWHNDTTPSFEPFAGLRVWVNYADPAVREFDGGKRFIITSEDGETTHLETDNWLDVLLKVGELKDASNH